jgi:hypothetical protein
MKQYNRYQMNFSGKMLSGSGICMGLSIFLLAVYYLFVVDLSQIPNMQQALFFWIPIGLCVIYIVLLALIRWNAPGLFAIVGCLFCIVFIANVIAVGNVLRIVLAILGYILCGGVLVLTAGGFLPGKLAAAVCFLLVAVVRLLCFALGKISGIQWLPEIAMQCILLALMLLPLGYIPGRLPEKE